YTRHAAGRVREAVVSWDEARRARGRAAPHDRMGEGADLARSAYALRELGEYEQARGHANEALAISRAAGSAPEEAFALSVLAVLAADDGLAAEATSLATRAVAIATATGLALFEALTTSALVIAHQLGGRLREAADVLATCAERVRSVGLVRLEG